LASSVLSFAASPSVHDPDFVCAALCALPRVPAYHLWGSLFMTLPTASEVTAWWLYGQATKPANLVSDTLIRAPENNIPRVAVDPPISLAEFMGGNGPGRFALGSMSELVQRFFSPNTPVLTPGTYSKSQMATLLGLTGNDFYGISIKQSDWNDGKGDYGERVYIWNSGTFKIADDADFVINADGSREIRNYAVVPVGPDNFNFDSTDTWAQWAAEYLQNRMDPSRIGRTVELGFSGDVPRTTYTVDSYHSDIIQAENAYNPNPVLLKEQIDEILISMWGGDETTKFLDQDERPILYGTSKGDDLTAEPNEDLQYLQQYWKNGVVLVGGAGADALTGGDAKDHLLGGDEIDAIIGGKGDDKLSGGDGSDFLVGGIGNDELHGGEGADKGLEDGFDTADYSESTSGIKVDLTAGTAKDGTGGTDTLISIEGFIGSHHDDEFKIDEEQVTIDGGNGNDHVFSSATHVLGGNVEGQVRSLLDKRDWGAVMFVFTAGAVRAA
jgi:hypothetical protein